MTVYTTTIASTPTDFNGDSTTTFSSERINDTGSNFLSSEDYPDKGMPVIDGKTGDRKSVYSPNDLEPSDIVNVGGIPMTVAQAKAAGFTFDANQAVPVNSQDRLNGAGDYDDAPAFDVREEGAVTDAETVAMDNVVAAVVMHTGLEQDAAIELGKDILTGEIAQDDVIWTSLQDRGISKQAAAASVQQVVQIGQSAAMRELGPADYAELSRLADSSAAIKNAVIDHGIKRMNGKAKLSWKDVLTLARQFAKA